jgi:hypothetical protein
VDAHRLRDGADDLVLVGYIATQSRDTAPESSAKPLRQLLAFRFFSGGEHEIAAEVGKRCGDGLSELAVPPGHEGYPPVEPEQL